MPVTQPGRHNAGPNAENRDQVVQEQRCVVVGSHLPPRGFANPRGAERSQLEAKGRDFPETLGHRRKLRNRLHPRAERECMEDASE